MRSSNFVWFAPVFCLFVGCIAGSPGAAPAAASAPPSPVAASEPIVHGTAFAWPEGARAAVSLTYDDALQSQLDHALPALKKHALPATFFLSGASGLIETRADTYRELAAGNIELGSHTINHPCDKAQGWVKPGFGLQDYDLARMHAELEQNLAQLRELGQKEPFSFAYPCGATWLGEQHESYVPLVHAAFVAGRTVAARVFDATLDQLVVVPSVMGNASGTELTAWVERAVASGGWVVFTFHGVAGDYLPVAEDAHEALLSYLEQHKSSVWTERFGTVASYAKAHGAK